MQDCSLGLKSTVAASAVARTLSETQVFGSFGAGHGHSRDLYHALGHGRHAGGREYCGVGLGVGRAPCSN